MAYDASPITPLSTIGSVPVMNAAAWGGEEKHRFGDLFWRA